MKKRTKLGKELETALGEVLAHRRGEIGLEVREVVEMSAARVREIRKKVANSPKAFERKYGIPARTVEGWEQGRRIDVTTRVLLTVIDKDPEAVERALATA